jgi:serine/threonine protein kinase/tetratricopeptide (TPR) repeat protein
LADDMDADRWRQIADVLASALGRDADERATFLDSACKNDSSLRDDVEGLLANAAGVDAFFEQGPSDLAASAAYAGAATLNAGAQLGTYLIDRPLGHGGAGQVFLAYDTALRRKVAIKILDSSPNEDVSRSALLREARSAATLNHPNICTVYEVGEDSGRAFMAMEYVDGRPLPEVLDAGVLAIDDALGYGLEVADALAYAHEQGIIHRDLKAANIIASAAGHPKIVDFGLARRIDAGTANATTASWDGGNVAKGTPYAMAPEQVRGGVTDARTDVWALGVLLYQMLTNAKPFTGPSTVELFSSILRDSPAPLPSSIPVPLRAIVYKCLAKDPTQRYQRASDVRLVLETITSSRKSGSDSQSLAHVLRIAAIAILFLALIAAAVLLLARHTHSEIRSIAVLPFVNLSQDPNQEFFVDGVTDGIVNTLGRVSALRVTARTSVMPFKNSKESVSAIASELGVDAVLEGSAMLARDDAGHERIHIAVNLIDPHSQTQIWSDTLDRELGGVLSLQAEIVRTIADKINIAVTSDERKSLQRTKSVDPEAYKLYLLGRQEWATRDEPGLKRAIKYFGDAIDRSPDYAAAYAGLADTYVLMAGDLGILSWDIAAPQAVANATKALELDASLSEAHTSLAFTKFFLLWDWNDADGHFRQAVQLNPSYATAHHWYGDYLSDIGSEDEALAEMRTALSLDPLSSIISRDVAWPLFFSGRYSEAIEQLQQTLKEHDGFMPAERLLARTYAQVGKFEEALLRFEHLIARQNNTRDRCELAWAYALAGRRADAERELASAINAAGTTHLYPYDLALVYTALGKTEDAFSALDRGFTEHDPTMVNLKHDPRLAPLHSDSRYGRLLDRMRFPK